MSVDPPRCDVNDQCSRFNALMVELLDLDRRLGRCRVHAIGLGVLAFTGWGAAVAALILL
ncbi:MAG: hypothetical protein MI806_34270 [Minwuiales bacterium]|nr:hypothetical protein [Minwuiales bacterium]